MTPQPPRTEHAFMTLVLVVLPAVFFWAYLAGFPPARAFVGWLLPPAPATAAQAVAPTATPTDHLVFVRSVRYRSDTGRFVQVVFYRHRETGGCLLEANAGHGFSLVPVDQSYCAPAGKETP